ncbi:YceD family protein [Cellulophaga sp. Asnod2-G02]|uniref:YceD family protein n=1 Tax=Cellulophaga sp. Asnod2-G02 TaxID=3160572 RepID=UPI0038695CB3
MKKHKEFVIPFSGLKQGRHEFNFKIDNTFFESFEYDEFNSAAINLAVVLNRSSTMLELEIAAKGTVNVYCDVTNEPYDQPIVADLELLVKFGDEFNDDNDEILILPHGDFQVDISQYVYEMIVLAVPLKKVHPGIEDGTLKSAALDKLEKLHPKEVKENKNKETDPRWDSLKKLLTDK